MKFEKPSEVKNETEPASPKIVLDESGESENFPEGEPGEVRDGYSFFAKIQRGDNEGNMEMGWEHITSDITDEPVLKVAGEEQQEKLSDKEIKAVPVKFVWNEEREIWQVVGNTNQ